MSSFRLEEANAVQTAVVQGMRLPPAAISYLQAAPLALILGLFLVVPLCAIVVVSFWTYDGVLPAPGLVFDNYRLLLSSRGFWLAATNTLRLAGLTWIITGVLGFALSYYLAFFVRSSAARLALLVACTIPFWTSNIIRMIAWAPLLGREGLINQSLTRFGIIAHPIDGLLYSDFAVVLAYVQLYTLFMLGPLLNAMARIEPELIEAAIDCGATQWGVVREVVAPLSRTGFAVGSVLVLTLVMGDFITLRVMSGGQSGAIGLIIYNEVGLVQYPDAAAAAVVLLAAVLLVVAVVLRFVDIRREI
jgi:putative spermidine/putrescine transport system permease protein